MKTKASIDLTRITLDLTRKEVEKLDELAFTWDCGPEGEGWMSPEMKSLSEKISSAIEGPENLCRYPNCVDESEDQRCPDWLTGDCPGPDRERLINED